MTTRNDEPLYLRVRVYLPDDAPESAKKAALEARARQFDPRDVDYFWDMVAEDFATNGIDLDRKNLTWSLDAPVGIGLLAEVTDWDKFLPFADARYPKLAPHLETLRALTATGAVSAKTEPGTGRYCYTNASVTCDLTPSTEAAKDAIDCLADFWESFINGEVKKLLHGLDKEIDSLLGWENVSEELDCMGNGLTEKGEIVPLKDCQP